MKKSIELKTLIETVLIAVSLFAFQSVLAQGARSDYDRAQNLRQITSNKVFKSRIRPHWLSDNSRFWYRNDLAEGARRFILVNAETKTRKPAFDHERLAKALAKATEKEMQSDKLSVDGLDFDESGLELRLNAEGKRWKCNLQNYEIQELPDEEQETSSLQSRPRAKASLRTGEETSITFINQTKSDVEVYWLDSGGQRNRYATVRPGAEHQQHTYAGHVWLVTDKAGKTLAVFVATEESSDAVIDGKTPPRARSRNRENPMSGRPRGQSPDGKWTAFIKDFNLYLRNVENGEEIPLTSDGTQEDAYSERFYFSPDSQKLVTLRTLKGDDRKVHLIESSPKDQLQPKLHTFSYAKPGDRIDISKPQLFDIAEQQQIPVSDKLFPNPWSISDIRWAPDSGRFTFLYNQRGHQVLRIVSVSAESGEASAIVDEPSKTFIDYADKQYSHYIDDTNEIIWMSERDGWNHLHLYDAQTGQVKNQITKGSWVVRRVIQVNEEARTIEFTAGGRQQGQDPYLVHYYRVNFDGTDLVSLAPGNGNHSVQYSPDRKYIIDTYSRTDQPPIHELRNASDGSLICELEKADASALLDTGWKTPEPFVAKGRDGETDIYGVIWRPMNLDTSRKYPVIEKIYAGPQGSFVPKSWSQYNSAQSLAELGFIVVQIDGMGTNNRSKKFHDVCWKNLGDSGFPDRILWMKAAAKKYPYMDIERVGVYGGSAGGQSALRAVLAHGDFYKVAVADCGCHDNRMDKIWWNELWMGWPIGPHYEEQSNVTQAHNLQGKLLLTFGELDRNVDPASSMQVVDALIKADKDFDLLIVPGAGHGVGESPYANRRRMDFFVRHLFGVEPRTSP